MAVSKLLIFSDIHGDKAALERLMAMEADYYFAAGDLANFGRGLDAMGPIMQKHAERMYVYPWQPRIRSGYRALLPRIRLSRFSRPDDGDRGYTSLDSAIRIPLRSTRLASTANRN